MVWRWVIRGVCVALLVVCVGAWVGSIGRDTVVGYNSRTMAYSAFVGYGRIGVLWERNLGDPWGWSSWSLSTYTPEEMGVEGTWEGADFDFVGFARFPATYPPGWIITVPAWFPAPVAGLWLWFVWRKTRGKYNGKGFPVEAGGGNGK